MAKSPTAWVVNPLASTADVVNYDSATTPYDASTQPYDGYSASTASPTTWKNPTAYTPLSELYQQYYGGPVTEVPLYAAPSHWVPNPGEINQAGQYVEADSSEADLYIYDGVTGNPYASASITYSDANVPYSFSGTALPYDSSTRNYDGVNPNNPSFYSWKQATAWTQVTGGSY